MDHRALAHTGGVYQAKPLSLMLHHHVHGIPGGACHIAHDRAIRAADAVDQRRLAYVWTADNGDVGDVAIVLVRRAALREGCHQAVQQVAGACAMKRRDGIGVIQT